MSTYYGNNYGGGDNSRNGGPRAGPSNLSKAEM